MIMGCRRPKGAGNASMSAAHKQIHKLSHVPPQSWAVSGPVKSHMGMHVSEAHVLRWTVTVWRQAITPMSPPIIAVHN